MGVTLGGILGHSICTGAAVLGGRQLATHIQERTVHVSRLPWMAAYLQLSVFSCAQEIMTCYVVCFAPGAPVLWRSCLTVATTSDMEG